MVERPKVSNDLRKEVRVAVGRTCVSVKVRENFIRSALKDQYRDFLSRKKPDIRIYSFDKFVTQPKFDEILYETKFCKLGRCNGRLILFFLIRPL